MPDDVARVGAVARREEQIERAFAYADVDVVQPRNHLRDVALDRFQRVGRDEVRQVVQTEVRDVRLALVLDGQRDVLDPSRGPGEG